ncbi:hypothetical protein F5I97DRAFT_1922768 [Phlebopus sp. FC_14]|nr:hypothetical protein F5I97DRAFT_1922768 [Phlebopus sp. FC_14]
MARWREDQRSSRRGEVQEENHRSTQLYDFWIEKSNAEVVWWGSRVITPAFLQECIALARQKSQGPTFSPTDTEFDLSLYDEYASSVPPYAISKFEATFYYAGISRSPPKLVYRTSKDPFVMPKGPEAYRRLKYLYPVYDHELGDKWEDVCPKVRDLLDKQQVRFSTIDLVRFRTVPNQQTPDVISPVVIWVGVLPDSLAGEDAFNSANAILALLEDEGYYNQLYKPASDLNATRHVIDPLTTTLGLPIAAARTPHFQGTMGLYFKDGDDLYGVTARHVLFPPDEINSDYTYNPSGPRKEVLLMGTKAWGDYLESVQIQIGNLGTAAGSRSGEGAEEDSGAAGGDDRCDQQASGALRASDLTSGSNYPDERLLEPGGILAEDRMRHPDTKDHDGENCLYVIKRGLTTLTTIGHATGFFSHAREYFANQTHRDSIEWAILPYDNDSGAFSKGGDSGSMIASGIGEFGGLLTGGSGRTESSDITYATPMFWLWLIIKAKFPNANLNPVFTRFLSFFRQTEE